LELTFQLEEGETYTEPVPSRDRRNAILVYEATEGGAGVLSRVIQEPGKLAEVARAALELMHYENLDAAISAQDAGQLTTDPDARCVKGCYRCLLSYYNQPDHEYIDRTDPEACRLLLRLAASTVHTEERQQEPPAALKPWVEAIEAWGLAKPSDKPMSVDGVDLPLVWREHRIVAVPDGVSSEVVAKLESMAFTVFTLPNELPTDPPVQLAKLLGDSL
jgi:hypothetical protein